MGIQSNINQTISLLGLIGAQTPLAERQKERARHEQKVKQLQRNVNLATEAENVALQEYEGIIPRLETTGRERGLSEAEISASIMATPEYQTYTQAGEGVESSLQELMREHPSTATVRSINARRREAYEQAEREAEARLARENRRTANSNTITRGVTEPITGAVNEPAVREVEERPRIGVTEVR